MCGANSIGSIAAAAGCGSSGTTSVTTSKNASSLLKYLRTILYVVITVSPFLVNDICICVIRLDAENYWMMTMTVLVK